MEVNDKLIVSHNNRVFKIQILEVSNETILYKNIDNYSNNVRILKHEFDRDFKIIEYFFKENGDTNVKQLLND